MTESTTISTEDASNGAVPVKRGPGRPRKSPPASAPAAPASAAGGKPADTGGKDDNHGNDRPAGKASAPSQAPAQVARSHAAPKPAGKPHEPKTARTSKRIRVSSGNSAEGGRKGSGDRDNGRAGPDTQSIVLIALGAIACLGLLYLARQSKREAPNPAGETPPRGEDVTYVSIGGVNVPEWLERVAARITEKGQVILSGK